MYVCVPDSANTLIGTGIVAAHGGEAVFLRGPFNISHTFTHIKPHVTAGGGRGLSTLSRGEVTDAKRVPVVELKD